MIIEDVNIFYELTKNAGNAVTDVFKGVAKVPGLLSKVLPKSEQLVGKAVPKLEQALTHMSPAAEKAVSELAEHAAPTIDKAISKVHNNGVYVKRIMKLLPDFSKNPKIYEALEKDVSKAFSNQTLVKEFTELVEKGNPSEIAAFIGKNVEKSHIKNINKFLKLQNAEVANQVEKMIGKIHMPFSSFREAQLFFEKHPNMSDAEKLEFASKLWTKGAKGEMSLLGGNAKLIEKEFGIASKTLRQGAGTVRKLEQVVARVGKDAAKEFAKNKKLIESLSKGSWKQRAVLYFGEKNVSSLSKGMGKLLGVACVMKLIYGTFSPKTGDENLDQFVSNSVSDVQPLNSDEMIQNIQSAITYKMSEEVSQKTRSYWNKFVPILSSYLKKYEDAKSEQSAVESGNISAACKMKLDKLAESSNIMARNIDKILPYIPEDLSDKLSEVKYQCESISATISSVEIA